MTPTSEQLWKAIEIAADDSAFFCKRKDGKIILEIICNDFWGYASADGCEVPWEKIDEVYDAWKLEGEKGLLKWAVKATGYEPLPPVKEWLYSEGKK